MTPLIRHPIEHLKDLDGEELLSRYESLDPDSDELIELHQQAIIEKYAEEIGYKSE